MKTRVLLCLAVMSIFTPAFFSSVSAACDADFYGTLRYNKQYTFYDDFIAGNSDKWMRGFTVDAQEQNDYNQSASFPTFGWTDAVKTAKGKIDKGTTVRVLQADSAYPIKAVPPSRSPDNFQITYTITYATDSEGKNQYTHTECKHYEISRCGDGVIDTSYDETCDPGDSTKKNRGNGGCSSSCKPITVASPSCNSSYNGKRVTSLVDGSYLCSEGTVSNFTYSESTHKWTWKCGNAAGSVSCSATKPYCGDGVKDSGEACDPNDTSKSGWGNGGCSSTCTAITVDAPVCNSSYNGQRVSSLTSSNSLCSKGTISNFTYNESTHKWTWKCNNTLGTSVSCSAMKPYCGDGVRDAGEACDPNDTSKTGWGNKGCDNSCEPIIESEGCDASFYRTLRYGKQYTFYDEFNANSSDKWLRGWQMEYKEQFDYNKSSSFPKFGRTSQLINNNYKVPKGTTMKVLEADSAYPILAIPTVRSYDNLFIKYSLVYSTDSAGQNKYGHSECVYYEISRCGDGTLDTDYDETCDPADTSKTNWGNGGCDDSCKPITVAGPVCNSDYNGQRVASLVNGSYLCTEGNVSEFKYDENTHKWTWKCDNVAGTESCYAIKPYCGDGVKDAGETCDPADPNKTGWGNGGCSATCEPITLVDGRLVIEKTLVGSKEVKNTGDIITWNIKVSAVDGDVTNFTITDKLPDVLEYDSYTVTHNPGLTVAKPTVTDNNVSWKVTGTLKKGDYIEIELKTKARWMPKVDYVNVACVRPESNPDAEDCDDVEIPVDGRLVIEKTLVGSKEVKNTGDIITWNIKVTAVDGDVTNFTITDKLPDVLEYDSYTVKHAGGVTVAKPTVTDNNVSWKVTGTLKKGDYVEIELKTKTRWMPKVDYVNVACVRPESNPDAEDCDDVEIPVDGRLVIEKTLVGSKEVKNTGDIITWNIKVSAVDGDVTNFTITDKLPDVLEYDSYTVTHNPGLTVAKPTVTDNNVSWKVTGTLKKGDYIEIELKTKARGMPKVDYVNVACVRPESNPDAEDCDDVEIPVDGRLVIEKTLVGSKEVKNTGDIITWNIKVSAVDGDVTNFTITDKMPSVLGYSGYFVTHNPGLTVGKATVNGNEVSWKVTGTLEKGEYLEIQLTTYAKVMPDKDYKNVACVRPESNPNDEKCDDEPLPAPHLWIKKHFTDGTKEKTVKIGDLIGYKIDFGNTGNASATITSLKDFLPKNVGYISSEIFVNGEKVHTNATQKGDMDLSKGFKVVDGVYIDIYDGITLKPGDSGYIILTGKILGEYTGNRQNFACIYLNDKKIDCDDVVHNIEKDKVSCKPTLGKSSFAEVCSTDNSTFSTTVTCKASGEADIQIICDGSIVKTGHASQLTGTCSATTNNTDHKVQCKINGKTTGENGEVCEASFRRNTKSCGGPSGSCFIAGTKVTMSDGSQKNIEDVIIGEKILGSDGEINTVLGYDRPLLGNRHLWSINGSEYFVSDEHPFKTTEGWKSFNPEMTKLEIDLNTTELRLGDVLITDNGLEEIRSIDYIDADYSTQLYNFVLDGNHTYYANSYLVHNKGGGSNPPDPDPVIYDSAHCFNVNTNQVSIEQGEILPFFWNISKMDNAKDIAYELQGGYQSTAQKVRDNIINEYEGNNCNENNLIALNSMICSFEIKNGNGVVYKGDFPCLRDTEGKGKNYVSDKRLLDAWMTYGKNKYRGDGSYKFFWSFTNEDNEITLRSNLNYIEKFGSNVNMFGEYKLSLNNIQYLQCRDGKWTLVDNTPDSCENDFVLTNPYTVQKTPSGNLKASTENLGYFFMNMDGKKAFNYASEYLNAIASSEASYAPTQGINDAMDNFIKKYSKLAVSVGDGYKKVPGKNIYFIEKDIYPGCNGFSIKLDKPVTFVQTNGNTTICGDIDYNMMLLTKGTITFKDDDSCKHRQTVKGILYGKSGISRNPVKKNIDLNSGQRCDQGGLTIKGVLIGKGLNNMMVNSRSNLNGWFESDTDPKRRKVIMDGASVLIEYSPSVFTKSTMPPGAEDFTTALSIYKQ